jgi:hypothetical protein
MLSEITGMTRPLVLEAYSVHAAASCGKGTNQASKPVNRQPTLVRLSSSADWRSHPISSADWRSHPISSADWRSHPISSADWRSHPISSADWRSHPISCETAAGTDGIDKQETTPAVNKDIGHLTMTSK